MILDNVTVEENFQRFLKRIIERETVYYLANEQGVANSISNDDEQTIVLMFWSDRAYATRVKNCFDEQFNEEEIDLFDFLYRWLPGMSSDHVLAGPNWNGDLVGKEIDPFELRELIETSLTAETVEKHKNTYDELTRST